MGYEYKSYYLWVFSLYLNNFERSEKQHSLLMNGLLESSALNAIKHEVNCHNGRSVSLGPFQHSALYSCIISLGFLVFRELHPQIVALQSTQGLRLIAIHGINTVSSEAQPTFLFQHYSYERLKEIIFCQLVFCHIWFGFMSLHVCYSQQ